MALLRERNFCKIVFNLFVSVLDFTFYFPPNYLLLIVVTQYSSSIGIFSLGQLNYSSNEVDN